MDIKIIMGPPCSGKSTFIKENFPSYKVIDLYDFQEHTLPTFESIMKSYEMTRDALVEALKKGDNVVLEHTLLKQKRRSMYIKAIKQVTDIPIDIYVMKPSADEYFKRMQLRDPSFTETEAKLFLDLIELPEKEEGFNNIYLINT